MPADSLTQTIIRNRSGHIVSVGISSDGSAVRVGRSSDGSAASVGRPSNI